ncbi:MAG TPA: DUF2141 domain-containing protein [Caulobacteraceae bacterium]|nr:DUF2141 domain-containing protein [Caulobacteraceae bacterium]
MHKRSAALSTLLFALAFADPGAAQPASTVEITFEVGASTGAVMAALYDSEAGYGARKPVRAVRVDADSGRVVARFEGLPPGTYALQAFHDLNGDGRMNTNVVGFPTEPFAFSNNAQPRGGPASWSAAAFQLGPQGAAQTVTIR